MNEVTALSNIDYSALFVAVFTILVGLKAVISIFEGTIGKLGLETKWMRKKREERELLIQTSQNLSILQQRQDKAEKQSDAQDEIINKNFTVFMDEVKTLISETQSEIKQFYENRVHDREQSREIQKELTDSIKSIVERNTEKDQQMDNLMAAQREVLADKINEKYKYYISIKGIPEDEIDEFTNLHTAYKAIRGNHSGDAKYEYCINHLPVLPVKTKLIIT